MRHKLTHKQAVELILGQIPVFCFDAFLSEFYLVEYLYDMADITEEDSAIQFWSDIIEK